MPALGSILSCGAYVPRLRLPRSVIAQAVEWMNPQARAQSEGARAVCSWDEDALTLAVAAARDCLAGQDRTRIGGVTLASTTLPFADRDDAALVAAALDLPETIETANLCASLRAGTSALASSARGASGAPRLVIAADARRARPGSAQELAFGHGAAALLVGAATSGALATVIAAHHLAADFVDHYRLAGEDFDYVLEERWVRDEGYVELVPRAIRGALAAAQLQPREIHRLVMPGTAAVARRVGAAAGLEQAQLQDNLQRDCGDTGCAHALLMLAGALESAGPDENVLLIGFGQGVDALVLRTHAARSERRPVAEALARRMEEPSYVRYLAHSGLLEMDFGMRAERDNRTAHTVAWRKHRQLDAFVGGRCGACGTVQFPRTRVCVNPECRATDTQADEPLADTRGRVKSFTEDWQAYSPRPPYVYGNVELELGGNLLMEIADVQPGELAVGDPVRFVFRIKDVDRARGFRRYFWKATKV